MRYYPTLLERANYNPLCHPGRMEATSRSEVAVAQVAQVAQVAWRSNASHSTQFRLSVDEIATGLFVQYFDSYETSFNVTK